jgi:polar amino acid transport system permease protein
MHYDWNFLILANAGYLKALGLGMALTIGLTVACAILGTPMGVLLGFMASERSEATVVSMVRRHTAVPRGALVRVLEVVTRSVRIATIWFIDLIRAIPLLLLILAFYYGIPSLLHSTVGTGMPRPGVSATETVILAMALNLAAFVGDLVRNSAASVSTGSILAAQTLGLSPWQTWRRIILPEVMRDIFPGLGLLYITMLKLSTLASVVAVYEVLHTADGIIQETYRPLELYVAVCALFAVVVMPLGAIGRRLETTRAFRRRA